MGITIHRIGIVPRVNIGSITIDSTEDGNLAMISQTPSKLYVSPACTSTLTLAGVVDSITGVPWSASGTISGTLVDDLGNPVQEFTLVPIPYVPGSNGGYQVSFGDSNFEPLIGTSYTLVLDGQQGSVFLHKELLVEVVASSS